MDPPTWDLLRSLTHLFISQPKQNFYSITVTIPTLLAY